MDAIDVMTEEISRFRGGVVLVTHDEGILRSLANKLIIFHEDRAVLFDGTYENFLETSGWEEEGPQKKVVTKKKFSKKSKKGNEAVKGKRPEPATNKSRSLSALTKEYEEVEEVIRALESELEDKNKEVLRLLDKQGNGPGIAGLYKAIGKTQSRIDAKYKKMEGLLADMDGLKAKG